MVNEEEYLVKKMGRGKPFSVPDGYFDQLAERIMQQLPQEEKQLSQEANKLQAIKKPATIKRLRPWLYAAACICVGVFIAAIAFNNRSEVAAPQPAAQQIAVNDQADYGYYSDTYIDEEADYAMIDNQEIYACLMADMY